MARETIRSPGKAYTEVDTEEKKRGGGIIKNSIETREQVKQKHLRIEWLRDKLDALPAVSR